MRLGAQTQNECIWGKCHCQSKVVLNKADPRSWGNMKTAGLEFHKCRLAGSKVLEQPNDGSTHLDLPEVQKQG